MKKIISALFTSIFLLLSGLIATILPTIILIILKLNFGFNWLYTLIPAVVFVFISIYKFYKKIKN
jgi:hypothetical protein